MCVSVGHPAMMVAKILLETYSSLTPFPKAVFVMVKRHILLSELTILTCPISLLEAPERNILTHMLTGFFCFPFLFRVRELKNVYCMLQGQHQHPLFFNAILPSQSFDFDCKAKNTLFVDL